MLLFWKHLLSSTPWISQLGYRIDKILMHQIEPKMSYLYPPFNLLKLFTCGIKIKVLLFQNAQKMSPA